MKKTAVKVLVPILALLMLLSMASSAKAYVPPPTKIPVTVYLTGTSGVDSNIKYVVKDGFEYLLYLKFWGTISIFDGVAPIATVNWVDVCWGSYDIATNLGSYTFFEVWTLSNGATFVGFDHPHSTGDLLNLFGIPTGNPGLTALEGHIICLRHRFGCWTSY